VIDKVGEFPTKSRYNNYNPMKTKASLQIFKLSTLVPLGIAITAACVAQIALGGVIPDHQLRYTENSSTDLTATYDGNSLSVQNTGPDAWNVAVPDGVSFGISDNLFGVFNCAEPTGGWNVVDLAPFSHVALSDQTNRIIEGADISNNTAFVIGVDTRDRVAVSFTFNDVSDAAAKTPDSGSSLGLLSLALVALFGAGRLRSLRLA
jgi:hypothetical protein